MPPMTIAVALRNSLKKGYSLNTFRHDLVAGVIVSLAALPLAMALAIAVGLPPEHGLYTAIVAGIVVPLLGGSRFQVSGPTAAFVVIIAPIVAEHGLRGLLLATLLAGVFLILFGILKLGRLISYIPYPVTLGFTTGIAVVIATLALNDLLGLGIVALQGSYIDKLSLILSHLSGLSLSETAVGLSTLAILFSVPHLSRKIPPALIAIPFGTIATLFLEVDTIGSRFVGGIPSLSPTLISLPTFDELSLLFVPALVIALLAALESLLSATVADSMTGTKQHPNSELVGIGIGNILSALAAGIPATGAIARTSLNIHSGAKTPLAAVFHACFILLYVLFLAPLLSYIPMASLAALLLFVAYHMSSLHLFRRTLLIAPTSDKIVLLSCFAATVLIDMVAGVLIGTLLACFLLLQRLSTLTKTTIGKKSSLPDDVLAYQIDGALFFGTAERAFERTDLIDDKIRAVLIDLKDVPLVDITGLAALKEFVLYLHSRGKEVQLLSSQEISEKLMQKLPKEAKEKILIL